MNIQKMRIKKTNAAVNAATNSDTAKYAEATNYIQSAIQALGAAAQDGDTLAKESIANLSVVLLDLK